MLNHTLYIMLLVKIVKRQSQKACIDLLQHPILQQENKLTKLKLFYHEQANSQGDVGCNTLPKSVKRFNLVTEWAKNMVFVGGLRG